MMSLKYLLVLLSLLLGVAVYHLEMPNLSDILQNKQAISVFIESHYAFSVVMFFLMCVVFINSPIPMAAVMKILSGYFFGFYTGAFYNILATLVACLVGFFLSRHVFKTQFERLFYARLERIEHEIERNGLYYFLSLRIVLVVPCFLINISAGLSRLSFRDYFLSTFLGVLPASLIYANGGQQLEHIRSTSELFEWGTIVSLTLMATISLLPIWIGPRNRFPS
jgi:uncharacterized membrane protein YdjX (TVP38/TMEM64 family)